MNPTGQRGPFAALVDAADGFGRALRQARTDALLSQWQLADIAGVVPACISRLESGNRAPSRATVTALADALDMTGTERVMFLSEAGYIAAPLDAYTARIVALWVAMVEAEATAWLAPRDADDGREVA